jgi:methylmalonyl-CoA/ethylmalonyl-CoA epimerase
MIKTIHHINFIVKDLSTAIGRYKNLLGIDEFIIDDLPDRGVKTARLKLGQVWLVLVQPVDMNGLPGQHLLAHGEGFFLISYAVDKLAVAAEKVVAAGSAMSSPTPRKGLENWQVWDIDINDTLGAQIQLCEEL